MRVKVNGMVEGETSEGTFTLETGIFYNVSEEVLAVIKAANVGFTSQWGADYWPLTAVVHTPKVKEVKAKEDRVEDEPGFNDPGTEAPEEKARIKNTKR